jgi:hypothetical protein
MLHCNSNSKHAGVWAVEASQHAVPRCAGMDCHFGWLQYTESVHGCCANLVQGALQVRGSY